MVAITNRTLPKPKNFQPAEKNEKIMQSVVNGINVASLKGFAAEVEKDSNKSEAGFHIHTKWAGQTKSVARVTHYSLAGEQYERDFEIVSDEPVELLGQDTAPGPMELLLAALNACMSVGYVTNAALMGITIKSLEIETDTNLDLRAFLGLDATLNPGVDEIHYTVKINADATPAELAKLHEHVIRTSPNFHNLARGIAMSPRLEIVEDSKSI